MGPGAPSPLTQPFSHGRVRCAYVPSEVAGEPGRGGLSLASPLVVQTCSKPTCAPAWLVTVTVRHQLPHEYRNPHSTPLF